MSVIQSGVSGKEGFLVQMNGDYNLPFDEIEITGTFSSGTVLSDASTAVGSTTGSTVLGVLAEDVDGTAYARVMVRGNPSTINAQEIDISDATAATIYDALDALGIIVVNQ